MLMFTFIRIRLKNYRNLIRSKLDVYANETLTLTQNHHSLLYERDALYFLFSGLVREDVGLKWYDLVR